jgi:(R)-benzylsuccinyl-CoA dehydrogenase
MAKNEEPEIAELRAKVRRFVDTHLIPYEREWVFNDRRNEKPYELQSGEQFHVDPLGPVPQEKYREWVEAARADGLWALDVPREYGGQGIGFRQKMAVIEELGRTIVWFRFPPDAPNLHWLMAAASAEQHERYVLPYARGEVSSWLNLTEDGAGSDVSGIQTTANKVDGGWVVSGGKKWVGGADYVDFRIIVAVTDREKGTRGGMTAFIVDRDTPGYRVVRRIPTIAAIQLQEVEIDNLFLADSQVLGEVGRAFVPLTNRLSVRRLEIASGSVGATRRMLGMMLERAKSRHTFGIPLSERQTVRNWIADAWLRLYATETMIRDVSNKIDAGVKDVRLEAGAAKLFATDMAYEVADKAIQLHGALGVSVDSPLEAFWRKARTSRIGEGPDEIQRDFIARALLTNGLANT